MKFDSVLKSNHDLKKNGYRFLRKLHKLEKHKGADRAYAAAIDDTYFFIIGCRALADIIKAEYPDAHVFAEKCDAFLIYLEAKARSKSRIDKGILSGFLRAYTRFFNRVIDQRKTFSFDQRMIELWNIKCLMAYVATWGDNH